MFKSQKHIFWQALLVTIFIFCLGIIFGVILENWRTNKIDFLFQSSEIDLLDIQLQSEIYSGGDFDCDNAISENMRFADRTYEEAKILDKYEKASRLTQNLILQHKKYDLLRVILLMNSIKIKERCKDSYYEIVYFYKYNSPSLELKARQGVFSNLLEEIKEIKGGDVLLIPMASDNNISSIDLILDKYGIDKEEIPIIFIDRKFKISEVQNIDDILKYLE